MVPRRIAAQLLFLPLFVTFSFAHHMAVVVNKANTTEGLTSAQLSKIVRGETKQWPDGQVVVLVLHKNSPGEAETLERLIKVSDAEWKAIIAAHKESIQVADSDAELIKLVGSLPGAVGLIDVRAVDSTIKVVRVGGKLPLESGYLPH
jgi:phosphate transport system substrate-binding protein